MFFLLLKLLGRACVGAWPGTARRLKPNKAEVKGCCRGTAAAPVEAVPGSGWAGVQGRQGPASLRKSLPSTCTGTGEGETKVPNELVKHLYNFSSFYKEGLLYTIYTWR